MSEYLLIIKPTVSPHPSLYKYNIEGYYEIGQKSTFKCTLNDFIKDVKDNIQLAERFRYIIEWEESYEKGRTNEKLGLAARAIYNFLESRGYDVMYEYE